MNLLNSSRSLFLFLLLPASILPINIKSKKNAPENLFYPTLENIHATTFRFYENPQYSDLFPIKTISAITNEVYLNFDQMAQINQVVIKNTDKTIKGYALIEKGISRVKNTDNTYITLLSRAYAQTPTPRDYLPKQKTAYERMVNFVCPDINMEHFPKKGGGVLSGYSSIRDNLVHTPDCINFDYPDTDELSNFSQRLDLNCLNTAFDAIPSSYETIGLGFCRGAQALIKRELLNEGNNRACALVLESPLFSARDQTSQIAKAYLFDFPGMAWISYHIYCALNPGIDPKQDNLKQLLTTNKIAADLPVLIIHIKKDPMVSDNAIFYIANSLAQYNNNIHLLVLEDDTKKARHGTLHTLEIFQQVVNSFYRFYNLPHNALLAQKGEEIFELTKINAQASSSKQWIITQCFEEK